MSGPLRGGGFFLTHTVCAGKDRLKNFMQRRSELALQTAEGTSMAHATAYNRHTVHKFFTNRREVRSQYP